MPLARTRLGAGMAVPLLFAAVLLALPAAGTGARAEMLVDRLIVDLAPASGWRQDVAVTNASPDQPLYVQATLREVLRPGLADEQEVARRAPEESGLLVSPVQLVLEPGQTKLVRILAVTPPSGPDRIYRLDLVPAVGEIVAQGTAIKIVVGYSLLIMAHAEGADYDLRGERQGDRLVLRNAGAATVLLERVRSCEVDEQTCDDLPPKRLYPGNEAAFTLTRAGPALLRLAANGESEEVKF